MYAHNNRPRIAVATLSVVGVLGTLGLAGCAPAGSVTAEAAPIAVGAMDMSPMHKGSDAGARVALYTAMAHLWAQHMEWTYATVVAFAEGSPALGPTLQRLLQNQADIGDAIRPFYGDKAGDRLTALLKTHIEEAVPVLTAAKAGDSAGLKASLDAWYANATEIGDFLASANPRWRKSDMEEMMRTHITQTVAYASDALAGDYTKAIADYGVAEHHMQDMADMLADGIIRQFPKQFR
jgi:hypothetical protein